MPYYYVAFLQSTYGDMASNRNNWSDSFQNIGQFFFLILAFLVVLVLTYYSTKWIASLQGVRRENSNMKIIEGISVGYQAHVQLIKVGEKYILVGVTKDKITYLTELGAEDVFIDHNDNKVLPKIPFEKYLNKYFKTNKDS